jgi:phage baseplate assembly protein W
MAIILKNKFVDDLNANQAIGVSIPFSSTSVFNQTFDTATQTKSNIINYFLTNKGERLLNPTYGGNLRNFLFETITPDALEVLQKRLREDIVLRFPIVEIKSLTINAIEDQNLINVTLIYNVLNLEDEVIEIGVETNSSL